MKCPFKERKNFHTRVGLLEDFFDPPTKSWHPKDLTNLHWQNKQISKEHQLTTMGIHVGIWILHLALLQKYRRNSMIAWQLEGFQRLCYIKFLKLRKWPKWHDICWGQVLCLVSEGCMTWADVDVQVFWSVSSIIIIIIILLVLIIIMHH